MVRIIFVLILICNSIPLLSQNIDDSTQFWKDTIELTSLELEFQEYLDFENARDSFKLQIVMLNDEIKNLKRSLDASNKTNIDSVLINDLDSSCI